jgi:predicted ATPase
LSHGEGILSYFSGRYHIKGIYFIDEPETALSPTSQVKFLQQLQRLEAEGHAQFIIATHSPILLAHPGAQIFSFDSSRIEEVAYEDTNHYKIYKEFFADRTVFLGSRDTAMPPQDGAAPSEKEVCH